MNEFFIYLLKVSAGLGIIFLPYYLLFRNDPNLIIKRFYLLAGIVAAWIFPLITFRRPEMFANLTPLVIIDPNTPEVRPLALNSAVSTSGHTMNWIQLLIITYLTGLVLMLLKNLFLMLKWNLTWQKTHNGEGVAFHKSDQVFTIFARVFVPSTLKNEHDLNTILLHEKAHIDQLHFIDLMLMEFTLLLTWFNPFSWLISRMIKENHEHLADRQVLSAGVNPARYRAQLFNHTLGVNVFRLGNQFNHSLTIKRFNMMKKPRQNQLGVIKIALLIPIILITLGFTTGMTPQQKVTKGKVVFADSGEPAPGAAVIIEGSTVGTVTDADGAFMLEVDGNPNLVISFVGYSTLRIKPSAIKKKPLKLEPKVFQVDLESVPFAPESDYLEIGNFLAEVGKKQNVDVVVESTLTPYGDSVFLLQVRVIGPDPDEKPLWTENYKVEKSEIAKLQNQIAKEIENELKDYAVDDSKKPNHKGDELFYVVEDMPMFPGGKAALKTYIYSNLKYPESAAVKGISGEVLVQFLVTASGKLDDIKVAQSNYKGFEKPAMDVFKDMPDWNPGKQRGEPVQVQVVVPVRFNADME